MSALEGGALLGGNQQGVGGGATAFTALTDTPTNYGSKAGLVLVTGNSEIEYLQDAGDYQHSIGNISPFILTGEGNFVEGRLTVPLSSDIIDLRTRLNYTISAILDVGLIVDAPAISSPTTAVAVISIEDNNGTVLATSGNVNLTTTESTTELSNIKIPTTATSLTIVVRRVSGGIVRSAAIEQGQHVILGLRAIPPVSLPDDTVTPAQLVADSDMQKRSFLDRINAYGKADGDLITRFRGQSANNLNTVIPNTASGFTNHVEIVADLGANAPDALFLRAILVRVTLEVDVQANTQGSLRSQFIMADREAILSDPNRQGFGNLDPDLAINLTTAGRRSINIIAKETNEMRQQDFRFLGIRASFGNAMSGGLTLHRWNWDVVAFYQRGAFDSMEIV